MQLIYWNGPHYGLWNATINTACGHITLSGVPGYHVPSVEERVRVFGDEQEGLPPGKDATEAFFDGLGVFSKEDTGTVRAHFAWVDGSDLGSDAVVKAKAATQKGSKK